MEKRFDEDQSFFNITSPDLEVGDSVTELINRNIIDLTITEELGKHITGSLAITDPNQVWSKAFVQGKFFNLSWGYTKFGKRFDQLRNQAQNQNEMVGNAVREGIECVTQTPTGSLPATGDSGYNITFYGGDFIDGKKKKVFTTDTRGDVITKVFKDMGITDTKIDFTGQNTQLSTSKGVRQWETNFAFLLRKAQEWQTLFHLAYKTNGTRIGLFIDHNKYDTQPVKEFMEGAVGARGSQRSLFYKAGPKSNVISGNWKQNIGESGQGDGVSVQIIDGKAVQVRRVIKDQKVLTYRLNTDRVRKEIESKENISGKFKAGKEILSAKDFQQVKRFFDPVEESTAPQGLGYEITVEMMGDPLLSIPIEVIFKEGFPPALGQTQDRSSLIRFFIRKVTHKLSKSGYKCSVTIGDTHANNGTFLQTQAVQ